jgi:hypothetical protein
LANVTERFNEKLSEAGISEQHEEVLLDIKSEVKQLKEKLSTIETEVNKQLVSNHEDLASLEEDVCKLKNKFRRITMAGGSTEASTVK